MAEAVAAAAAVAAVVMAVALPPPPGLLLAVRPVEEDADAAKPGLGVMILLLLLAAIDSPLEVPPRAGVDGVVVVVFDAEEATLDALGVVVDIDDI